MTVLAKCRREAGMKTLLGLVVGLGIIFGAAPSAQACCNYGCCNCSCVAAVPPTDAQKLMQQIKDLLRKQGLKPETVDLVVKTQDRTVVLHQKRDEKVQQPGDLKR
jgi:hypothetical protein